MCAKGLEQPAAVSRPRLRRGPVNCAVAVTPTFSRPILMPKRLRQFTEAIPKSTSRCKSASRC